MEDGGAEKGVGAPPRGSAAGVDVVEYDGPAAGDEASAAPLLLDAPKGPERDGERLRLRLPGGEGCCEDGRDDWRWAAMSARLLLELL